MPPLVIITIVGLLVCVNVVYAVFAKLIDPDDGDDGVDEAAM